MKLLRQEAQGKNALPRYIYLLKGAIRGTGGKGHVHRNVVLGRHGLNGEDSGGGECEPE